MNLKPTPKTNYSLDELYKITSISIFFSKIFLPFFQLKKFQNFKQKVQHQGSTKHDELSSLNNKIYTMQTFVPFKRIDSSSTCFLTPLTMSLKS